MKRAGRRQKKGRECKTSRKWLRKKRGKSSSINPMPRFTAKPLMRQGKALTTALAQQQGLEGWRGFRKFTAAGQSPGRRISQGRCTKGGGRLQVRFLEATREERKRRRRKEGAIGAYDFQPKLLQCNGQGLLHSPQARGNAFGGSPP